MRLGVTATWKQAAPAAWAAEAGFCRRRSIGSSAPRSGVGADRPVSGQRNTGLCTAGGGRCAGSAGGGANFKVVCRCGRGRRCRSSRRGRPLFAERPPATARGTEAKTLPSGLGAFARRGVSPGPLMTRPRAFSRMPACPCKPPSRRSEGWTETAPRRPRLTHSPSHAQRARVGVSFQQNSTCGAGHCSAGVATRPLLFIPPRCVPEEPRCFGARVTAGVFHRHTICPFLSDSKRKVAPRASPVSAAECARQGGHRCPGWAGALSASRFCVRLTPWEIRDFS